MKRYADLLADGQSRVREVMPWDVHAPLAASPVPVDADTAEGQLSSPVRRELSRLARP